MAEEIKKLHPYPRPLILEGKTIRMMTGCGRIYVTINKDERGICEVLATIGKSGGCPASSSEALCRMISISLRIGMDVGEIIKHLKGINCPSPVKVDGKDVSSCADAIAQCLEIYLDKGKT